VSDSVDKGTKNETERETYINGDRGSDSFIDSYTESDRGCINDKDSHKLRESDTELDVSYYYNTREEDSDIDIDSDIDAVDRVTTESQPSKSFEGDSYGVLRAGSETIRHSRENYNGTLGVKQ